MQRKRRKIALSRMRRGLLSRSGVSKVVVSNQVSTESISSMDNQAPKVKVTTDLVLNCARGYGGREWTTCDIADTLNAEEHRVRAAVGWLLRNKRIEDAGEVRRYCKGSRNPYNATAYRTAEKGGAPDLATLEMAFGFCRAFMPRPA